MDAGWARWWLVVFGIERCGGFHDCLEGDLARVSCLGIGGVGLERGEQRRDALDEGVIDYALVLEGLNVVLALLTLGVNLVLLGSDEGALVDVGVDFDIRIVAELESILWTGG